MIIDLVKISYYRLKDIANEMTFLLSIGITTIWGFIVGLMVAFTFDNNKGEDD